MSKLFILFSEAKTVLDTLIDNNKVPDFSYYLVKLKLR